MRNNRLESTDLKHFKVLKHYRVIRQWASRHNDISQADLELLIYLDCIEFFNRKDFIEGTYSYSWDNRRWARLKEDGWISVFSKRNRSTIMSNVYKVSFKGKRLINKIYKIMLGEEDLPVEKHQKKINKEKCYTDKVLMKSIKYINKDKTINNGL